MKLIDLHEELDDEPEDPHGAFYDNGDGHFRVQRLAYVKYKHVIPPGISKSLPVNELSCSNIGLMTLEGAPARIHGDFYCQSNHLKDFKGTLERVDGTAYFNHNSDLSSFEGSLKSVRHMYVNNCGFTSLKGIHKHIKHMETFTAMNNEIKSHVLGLLLVPQLQEVVLYMTGDDGLNRLLAIEKILNEYLPNERGMDAVLECQERLIDIGAEEYAKL